MARRASIASPGNCGKIFCMSKDRENNLLRSGHVRFCRYLPGPSLRAVVRNFWTIGCDGTVVAPRRQRVVPDACMDILLVRRSPTECYNTYVVGTMTAPIFEDLTARAEYLGIRFAPGGFTHFFGIPVHELTDRIVPLESLSASFPSAEQLADSPEMSTRVEILESSLSQRLPSDRQDPSLARVLDTISACGGNVTISQLARIACWSPRHLGRRFHDSVGVGPKTFCKIIRFKNALHMLRHEPPPELLQVALEAGYYDQAHFIHDFNRFYGASPSTVLNDCDL